MASAFKKTGSRCTTEVDRGTHAFEIVGYSLKKGMGIGKHVRSTIFTVGGCNWALYFFPDGTTEAYKNHASAHLVLVSKNVKVRASCELRFVNHASGLTCFRLSKKQPLLLDSIVKGCFSMLLLRSELELAFLPDDRFTIECDLTVIKESQVTQTIRGSEIQVPPSELSEHFGKMLEDEEGADVTLSVGGETFTAHKTVLAARSPVFKAMLYSQMRERSTNQVVVEEMQPGVFRALLHFIYTDSFPAMGHLEGDVYNEMIRHLLVAADRYAMDRLKLMCQNILGKNLHVETVAATLAFADQHNCEKLKEVCVEFIASSNVMDAVVATKGYANLKRTCPSVLVDVFEKTSRIRKIEVPGRSRERDGS